MGRVVKCLLELSLTLLILQGQVVTLRCAQPRPIAPRDPWVPELDVEKYQLRNGLTVVLHEDHKTPLVAVNVTYNVGSKDDPPGRTGFAHLFEHVMFKGSQHSDCAYHWPIHPYMARGYASTGEDLTVYRTTVTRNALETVLWLEADRMGFLLPALTEAKLVNARNVVRMERRQNWIDPQLSEVEEALNRALYPPGHPYRHMTIGLTDDLSGVRYKDISAFSQKYYAPDNAFLSVAGDFRPAPTKRWIQKYFGGLSPSTHATVPSSDTTTPIQPRHITLTDRTSHSQVFLVWKTVPAHHPDEPALDVLASILGGPSTENRLRRSLIDDRQLAVGVKASHPTLMLAGQFELQLQANHGQQLEELVQIADAEMERLKKEGPTDQEVRRAKLERRNSQMSLLEPVTRKAEILNRYTAECGNPLAYRLELLGMLAVTPADVVRVARSYLGNARIELDVLPGERGIKRYGNDLDPGELDSQVGSRPMPSNERFDRSVQPDCAPTPRFVPPLMKTRQLSNGLEVRIIERHELPQVVLKLVIRSGETSTPRGKEGLASLALALLERATRSRSAQQLEADLLKTGSSLAGDGFWDANWVTLTTSTRRLEEALDLYADVILNPAFPGKELQRLKLYRLAVLESNSLDSKKIAEDVFSRMLYDPLHPYARPYWGTSESVQSITRQDVITFYRRNFVPGNLALVVVGDVRTDAIISALEKQFGKWLPRPVPPAPDLRQVVAPNDNHVLYLIDKPGAEQSVISVGCSSTAVTERAHYALEVLLKELAGRLSTRLCDEKGCSYEVDSDLFRRNGKAPWVVRCSVDKLDTANALEAVFEVLTDLIGGKPMTQNDIDKICDGMVPNWFYRFECMTDAALEVADLISHSLPDHQWATDLNRYAMVTEDEASRVARHYLTPAGVKVLIVGDRRWIESLLQTSPFFKAIILLDPRGNLLPNPPG